MIYLKSFWFLIFEPYLLVSIFNSMKYMLSLLIHNYNCIVIYNSPFNVVLYQQFFSKKIVDIIKLKKYNYTIN